ncbi:MAG: tripartite tricarboxylate transporter permease [Nanoarchaeota archaeon]
MFFAILATLAGICTGTLTGLVPGLHINLVNTILLTLTAAFPLPFLPLCIFIIAMSITHTFLDAIPAIYLGAPDADHALTALPGHRMLLEGHGHQAVLLTLSGSYFSLIICILSLPLAITGISLLQPVLQPFISYILILFLLLFLAAQKTWYGRVLCLTFFCISGGIGLLTFMIPGMHQPLFPLLSGLFGLSILIPSLSSCNNVAEQTISSSCGIALRTQLQSSLYASFMGFVAAFLPGFGSSQAAIVATWLMSAGQKKARQEKTLRFLVMVGGINTANMALSLATAYVLTKARNGSVATILTLIPQLDLSLLLLLSTIAVVAGSAAYLAANKVSQIASCLISRIPYRAITIIIICGIVVATIFFDSIPGTLILLTSTATGLCAAEHAIPKHFLLGCLALPVILYLL